MAKGMAHEEVLRLLLQVTGAEDLEDLKAKAQGARSKLDELADANEKAGKSSRNMGRATLEGGRILQDFAQGGIGGILNNIEGLAVALGGGPGLAGVMTALGLAAYFAIPAVKSAWAAIVDGSNDVPEATGRLEGLRDRLGEVETRLKDLKEKGWLTDSELEEYNDKLARRVDLEEKITGEKEKQAAFDKARKAAEDGVFDKDSAAIAQEVVNESGGVDAAIGRVGKSMLAAERKSGKIGAWEARQRELDMHRAKDRREGRERILARGADGAVYEMSRDEYYDKLDRQYQEKIDAEAARVATEAEDEVAAALKGDPDAAARMIGLDKANAGKWVGATRGGLAHAKKKKEAEEEEKAREKEEAEDAARQAREERRAQIEEGKALTRADKDAKDAEDRRIEHNKRKLEEFTRLDTARANNRDREEEKAAAEAERDAERDRVANLPGNRLKTARDQAYQTAAGIAMAENNGEFNPAQLDGLAREAADTTAGPDVDSIRQALYRAAAMTRMRIQEDLNRQMGRMFQGGDSYLEYGQ